MIGITDFEMPKSCSQCDFCDAHGQCLICNEWVEYDDYTDDERYVGCPLVEIKPKTGHWITKPHVYGVTYCSECDFELKIDNTEYCPNCGVRMDKG